MEEEDPSGSSDDWMGVWGKQRFPHWRRSIAPTIAFKQQLVAASYSEEPRLQEPG